MVNVILDTDISNEIDDQFALCYLLRSLENINLEAITIAPFSSNKFIKLKSLEEGLEMSKGVAEKLIDMVCPENSSLFKQKIVKGAASFFKDDKTLNSASKRIIEICENNETTTIIAIGAITNIAVALYHRSDLASKMKIIWLGGNSFLSKNNDEYNFRQDTDAVKFIWGKQVELAVIPVNNVSSLLSISIFELQHYLSNLKLGRYLCQVFKDCAAAHRKDEKNIVGEAHPLFDVSAVAFLLNPNWFECEEIPAPGFHEDNSYDLSQESTRKITFVSNMNRNLIYRDLFEKIGEV